MTQSRPRQKTIRIPFLKNVATTLILCLVFQDFSYASADVSQISKGIKQIAPFGQALPKIPESIAVIEDRFSAKSPKTIYLIQDPHTNPSGQRNIAKTIEQLIQSE